MRPGDFKTTQFPRVLGILLLGISLAYSCGDRKKESPEGTVSILKSTEKEVHNKVDNKQEAELVEQIELFIDFCYEQPDRVIQHPDSFINQIKREPQSAVGKESYALLLLNMGYVLRENGDLLKSIRFYERAFDYCTQHELSEPDLVIYIAKPLANLYTRIDDVEKSITLHERAIEIASKNPNSIEHIPSLFNNLAIAYQQMGELDSVIKIGRKGISYILKAPMDQGPSINRALLYNTIANAFLHTQQMDSAEYYNKRALQLFKQLPAKGDTLIWYTSSLKLKSDIAKENQDSKTALHYLNKSIHLTNTQFPNSKQREKAKYLIARGELYSYFQPSLAKIDFYDAMSLLESDTSAIYVSDYTYTHALHGLARVYAQTKAIDSALYYYIKTIENDFQTQQLIVSKASSYKNSEWNRTVLNEYLDLIAQAFESNINEKEKQQLAYLSFWAIELSKGRQLLMELNRSRQWNEIGSSEDSDIVKGQWQQLYHQLVSERDSLKIVILKEKIAEFKFKFQLSEKYFEQQFLVSDFENFKRYIVQQSKLKTLVSYLFQDQGRVYIVSIKDAQAQLKVIQQMDMKQLGLNAFINDYFSEDPYVYENNPAEYAHRSSEIAKVLIPYPFSLPTNISSNLISVANPQKQTIVFSPDGPLFKLPMDALIQDGSFMAENNTVSYTYSFLLNFLHQNNETYLSKVLLFAKSKHNGSHAELAFVNEEKKFISNQYVSQVFNEDEATVNSFLAELDKPDILHIATHAVSDEKEGPYLVFENRLTLDGLAFTAIQSPLVILSACESANGTIIQAEGLESLNKTFLSKGVKGVVASQWPVDDQVTSQMMKLFYKEIYRLKNPIEALASAKRIYINESQAIHKNPWYWAAMTYMGSDIDIQLEKQTSPLKWSFIGAGLFVVCTILFFRYRKAHSNR